MSNEVNEEELIKLVENSKLEYPHLPESVINALCIDHLMYPGKEFKTDSLFNEKIEKMKEIYERKEYSYEGVRIEE